MAKQKVEHDLASISWTYFLSRIRSDVFISLLPFSADERHAEWQCQPFPGLFSWLWRVRHCDWVLLQRQSGGPSAERRRQTGLDVQVVSAVGSDKGRWQVEGLWERWNQNNDLDKMSTLTFVKTWHLHQLLLMVDVSGRWKHCSMFSFSGHEVSSSSWSVSHSSKVSKLCSGWTFCP